MITPQINMRLKVKKKVKIKDSSYSMPGPGHLNEGTIIQITSGPTRLSDLPFKVLSGSGEYLSRGVMQDRTCKIKDGSWGFFFVEGHNTVCPYDWGKLDTEYFEIVHDTERKAQNN